MTLSLTLHLEGCHSLTMLPSYMDPCFLMKPEFTTILVVRYSVAIGDRSYVCFPRVTLYLAHSQGISQHVPKHFIIL